MAILLLVGCGKKEMTEKEEKAFMDKYMDMVVKPSEPKTLEKQLDENIEYLSQKNASDAVDGLLYSMYQFLPEMNQKAQGLQSVLEKYEDKKVNFNEKKDWKKIKDDTLKAFLGEVEKRHLLVKKENGTFVVKPNMDYVLKKYEKYMKDDLKAMVLFSKEEYDEPFVDENTQTLKLDVVANRILKLEKYENKYKGSYYAKGFNNSKMYYYQVYFGMNNQFVVDSNQVVLPEVRKHYEKVIREHPNTQLAKDLKAYLAKLKGTNYKLTDDVYAFLSDMIQPAYTSPNSANNNKDKSSSNENKPVDETKKALKKAIEMNR